MTTWTLNIPVISTAHAPSMGAIVAFCDNNAAATNFAEGFIFLYIDTEYEWEGDEAWMAPIAAWMKENYPDEWWLRLDSCGDVIPELPTYEW